MIEPQYFKIITIGKSGKQTRCPKYVRFVLLMLQQFTSRRIRILCGAASNILKAEFSYIHLGILTLQCAIELQLGICKSPEPIRTLRLRIYSPGY